MCLELFQIKLDHDVLDDPPAFGGKVRKTLQPALHIRNTTPKARGYSVLLTSVPAGF